MQASITNAPVNKVQRHTFLRHDFVHLLYRALTLSRLGLFGSFGSETRRYVKPDEMTKGSRISNDV
jgi:hypothetical protein